MDVRQRSIRNFVAANGKSPFRDWLRQIKDKRAKARILSRIDRLQLGNFGDCRSVGDGVYELRVQFGPGFRIYFGLDGPKIVILLCGGDKSTQKRDVAAAHAYWKESTENGN